MNRFAVRQEVPRTDQDRLDTLVASACRVAAQREDVRAIFVVTNERPSFQTLMRYRNQASGCDCGLTVTMLGTGGVVVRRPAESTNESDERVRRNAE